MEWFLKVVRDNYFNFSGRARRKEYWNFILFQFLFMLPLYGLLVWAATSENITILYISAGLFALYSLALFIPSLAVSVRRLHDVGRSGWWYLITIIPFGGLVLLIWAVQDSQIGSNQWGEDPKAGEYGH